MFKYRTVKSINVTGRIANKLGCFDKPLQMNIFIDSILSTIPNSAFIEFKERFATTQKELDDFVEKLESCETKLEISARN